MKAAEIYCKTCYAYQEWKGQSHCSNPNCGTRLSNWHVSSQLQRPADKRAS